MSFNTRFTTTVDNIIYDITDDIDYIGNNSYKTFELKIKGDKGKVAYVVGFGDPIIKNNDLHIPLHILYKLLTMFNSIPKDVAERVAAQHLNDLNNFTKKNEI